MINDWETICRLAQSYHIEIDGKELRLTKHDTPIVDSWVEFPVGSKQLVNLPFSPHALILKASTKEDYVNKFTQAIDRWENCLDHG